MAITLEQVDTFHEQRGNAEWAELDPSGVNTRRAAALLKAVDYVEANYAPLKAEAENSPRYLMAVAILALRLTQNPQSGITAPIVKKETKEGVGFKKEVEFFEPVSTDPYPGVTGLIAPLRADISCPAVQFGRLVR